MMEKLVGYKTKGQIAYEEIRSRILQGMLAPGERLVIDQLASEFGVSKVPIREAVDRLIGEGWLERSPHIGPFVPMLTSDEVRETAMLRAALESDAIAHATPRHTDESLAEAELSLRSMGAGDGDFATLNVRFHTALIRPCPYDQLRSMAIELMSRAARFHTVLRLGDYANPTQEEHEELLGAVRAGDPDRAGDLTREHIVRAAEKLEAHLSARGLAGER